MCSKYKIYLSLNTWLIDQVYLLEKWTYMSKNKFMESPKRSLDITNAEHIGYKYGGIEITVLGGIRMGGLDRMRTTLKVQVEHLSLRHNLDLYNDTQVEKLVRKVAEKLEIGTSVITLSCCW